MKEESLTIHLQILCVKPPIYEGEPVIFGLQDRNQEVHIGQVQADGSILYGVDIPITRNRETNTVRFRSAYVHGTTLSPFLYLSVKRMEEQSAWVRRLKIPLPQLSWDTIDKEAGMATLIVRISGTGSGTVPLLDGGWKLEYLDAAR